MIWIQRLQAQKKGSHELLQCNMGTFCQRLYHRKCQRRGVGGQKSQNLVNVVCEQPLTESNIYENFLKMSFLLL